MYKLTIYLSGHTKECTYRNNVKKEYGNFFRIIDPMDISIENINNLNSNVRHIYIVRRDKKLILQSDILVAYVEIGSTFGTSMEIEFAKFNNIPVYVINPNQKYMNDIWLKYNTDKFFSSISSCFNFLLGENNGK